MKTDKELRAIARNVSKTGPRTGRGIPLNADEDLQLEELADHHGETRTTILRFLIAKARQEMEDQS